MSIGPEDDKYCTLLGEEEEGMYSDVCTNDNKKLWENGIVSYVFHDNVTEELKSFAMKAMSEIVKVSSINFVERMDQKDYIEIIDKGKFASYVGRKGDKQELYISKDTDKWPHPIGNCMHELLHALGFYHEHCRPDRDRYVTVEGTGNNYEILEESNVLYSGPYDLDSIMHYSNEQGVKLRSGISAEIGQRIRLSDGDIFALNILYPPEIIISRLMRIPEDLIKNDSRSNKITRIFLMASLSAHGITCMHLMKNDSEQEPMRFRKVKVDILREINQKVERIPEHLYNKLNEIFEDTLKELVQNNTTRRKKRLMELREMEKNILDKRKRWTAKINDKSASLDDFRKLETEILTKIDRKLEETFERLFRNNISHEKEVFKKLNEMSKKMFIELE